MTMDIYQRAMRADSSSPAAIDSFHEQSTSAASVAAKRCQKTVKRSFDVAFLMAPDDLSKRRRNGALATAEGNQLSIASHSPPRIDIVPRSAFTKVAVNSTCIHVPTLEPFSRTPPVALSPSSASSTASNRSGLSPDLLAYQDSLSPQPFVPSRSPVHLLPSKHHTNTHPHHYQPSPPQHTNPFLKKETDRYTPPQLTPMTDSNLQFLISNSLINDTKSDVAAPSVIDDRVSIFEAESSKKSSVRYSVLGKHNLLYHADNGLPYSSFPIAAGFPFPTTLVPVAAAAAAANLGAALLPSSLATFTLPAQNVCAKCNMHFRMTSDLVYHMRSQHKNENAAIDTYKRRRDQDKLKCPVCRESFRERHHLTRHMTAHQDKEDEEEVAAAVAVTTTTTAITKDFVDIRLQRAPISGSAK